MKSRLTHPLVGALVLASALGFAAAAQAQDQGPSFEQVLAEPDNLDLNLRFAEAEIRDGNLLSASAALERILLKSPGWSQARLLYAAVLYRLDDLPAARQQLDQLDESRLSDLQKAEARRYRSLIANRRAPVTYGGEVSIGIAHHSDVIGQTALQLQIPGLVLHESGASSVVDASLGLAGKLTAAGDVRLIVEGRYLSTENLDTLPTDYRRLQGVIGVASQGRMNAWRAFGVVRDHRVLTDHYLSEAGGRIEWSYRPTTQITVFGGVEQVHQSYDEPTVDTLPSLAGRGHDGAATDISVGVSHRLDARNTVGFLVGMTTKRAEYSGFSYQAPRFQMTYDRQFDAGAYVSLLGSFSHYDYKAPDVTLFGAVRDDRSYRLRAAVGAPLSIFSKPKATGDVRESTVLEAAAFYDSRSSASPLADYSSAGAEIRLIFRFGQRR